MTASGVCLVMDGTCGSAATTSVSGTRPSGHYAQNVGGLDMAASRKFRNVAHNPHVASVVDDLASIEPGAPRGAESRGTADNLLDVEPPMAGFSRQVIRITPTRIAHWGLEPGTSFDLTVRRAR